MSQLGELSAREAEHAKRLGLPHDSFRYYRKDALVPGAGNSTGRDPHEAQRKLLYDHGFYPQAWALAWNRCCNLMMRMPNDQAADLLEENGYSKEAALFRKTDNDPPEEDEFST